MIRYLSVNLKIKKSIKFMFIEAKRYIPLLFLFSPNKDFKKSHRGLLWSTSGLLQNAKNIDII